MNYSPIIDQVFSTLWYLIPIALMISVLNSAWFKGIVGEFKVNLLLKLFLPKNTYHLIKNVTLPTEDGTTQIDHIVVSKYGVFVIETKNMKGWIFGSAHQKQWTQRIFKHSNKFQNPIHQNYKHLKTLESCLGIPFDNLHSVIVFIGNSTFKTNMPENVIHAGGCIRYIKSKKVEVFSQSQVLNLIEIIGTGKLQPGFTSNRKHVSHVKAIIKAKDGEKYCPKCGAKMVIRESKKGANAGSKFWGCSTFPKCRAVAKIT